MFDSLKKRLREAVEKVSRAIKEEPKLEKKEEPRKTEVQEVEQLIEQPVSSTEPVSEEKPAVEVPSKIGKKIEKIEKEEEQVDKMIEDLGIDKETGIDLGLVGRNEEKLAEQIGHHIEEKFQKEKDSDEYAERAEEQIKQSIEFEERGKDKTEDVVNRILEEETRKERADPWSTKIEEEEQEELDKIKEEKKDKWEPRFDEPEPEEEENLFDIAKKAKDDKLKPKIEPPRTVSIIKPEIKTVQEEKKKPGIFARLFEKTLTEDDVKGIMKELELALLENDVALEVAEHMVDDVKKELLNRSVRRGKIEDVIKEALRNAMLDVMRQEKIDVEKRIREKQGIFTIMFLGFNGTGKTTTLSKFATKFKKFNPVVAAGDTFRAASIEQLEEHSRRVGFRVVKHQYGSDSAAVIFDAKKAALASGSKLVLADTAGRSHSNINLMDELKKVVRVNSPDLKILVLDSLTGNDIYEQSRLFNDAVGVDAVILTKVDVYDKGGAALSTSYTIKKPILYLGVGQEYGDLKEFSPEEVADSLLK